jgi:ABC-type polysaccharide/polyol phosphate transport system ATPase subunit
MSSLLELRGVGKQYRLGGDRPLLQVLRRSPRSTRWVLRDIDLHVAPGEIVAVIGRNGAGKSTLLKVAAGVTEPTTGTVDRPLRIAPLIEVGAGFHPDLSGRENVQVNGQLLGMTKREVERSFDDIVSFAELSHAIDQPVRQYSSGMFMRLGFSVAIHTAPELLIVDEVLAVGDLPFQVRCLDRIKELREEGVGVLFVSHNLTAVLNLADRALLLDGGAHVTEGSPNDVVGRYHDMLAAGSGEAQTGDDVPPSGELVIEEVRLVARDGATPSLFEPGQQASLEVRVRAVEEAPKGILGFRVLKDGVGVVAHWRGDHDVLPPLSRGEVRLLRVDLDVNLAEGGYVMAVAIARHDWTTLLAHLPDALRFGVGTRPGAGGIADLSPRPRFDEP